MQKPVGYDEAVVGGFTPIKPGGHYLTILGVKETTTKNGFSVLAVQFDTSAQDEQPNYFRDRYESDQERFDNVRYQGQHNIFLPEGDPQQETYKWNVKALKRFITAVQDSNPGFIYQWGDINVFRGKQVGGVFGVEEYNDKTTGDLKRNTKLRYFVSIDEVETAEVPKVKEARPSYNDHIARAQQQDSHNGYFPAPEDNTALPFDL